VLKSYLTAALWIAIEITSLAAEHRRFDSAGVPISYTQVGSGEPVILVHGYMASGVLNWGFTGVTELLAQHYRVIVMDVRGHGGSGKPESRADYGIGMVEDVVRLMDHLKIEKAHVVGYSMGGMIVLKMASLHPERLQSGIVGGMGWIRSDEESPFHGLQKTAPNEALSCCAASFKELSLSEAELRAIRVPLTIIIGDQDALLEKRVKPMQKIRPDGPIIIVPDSNHKTCIFKPSFKESILETLRKNERPAPSSSLSVSPAPALCVILSDPHLPERIVDQILGDLATDIKLRPPLNGEEEPVDRVRTPRFLSELLIFTGLYDLKRNYEGTLTEMQPIVEQVWEELN